MLPLFIRQVGTQIRPTWHSKRCRTTPAGSRSWVRCRSTNPNSRARIASWRDQPGMLGLRYTFLHDPARTWLADGTIDWLWAEAEKAGVPIATLATDSLTDLGRIARTPPRPAIDHRSPGRQRWPDHAEGCRGHDPHAGASGAGKIPQCRSQGNRRPRLFQRTLSVSRQCKRIYGRFTMPSVRAACSGARTSRRCPVPGANA